MDLGSGDGRGPYRWASREPDRLFVASDAIPARVRETGWKARRKHARGGISNLVCIAETLDVLAAELGAVADRVTVILPWGSLLRSVAAPDVNSLRSIAGLRSIADLCLPDATIEIVFSYDSERDARERAPLGVSVLDERHMLTTLPRLYEQACLPITLVERLSQKELATYETTWAKRLAFGRSLEVWRVAGKYFSGAGQERGQTDE